MDKKLNISEIKDKNIWERFVLSQKPKSFLQSWAWGETNNILGKKVIRVGIYNGTKLVGISQFIKEEAKRGWHLLIPGGPILDWGNEHVVKTFLSFVKELLIKEKCIFVRVRPELLDIPANRLFFKENGFIESPMHLHAQNTWVLDITKKDDEILKGMRKSTRYLVKKSLSENLIVQQSSDINDARYIKSLQDEVVERSKFVGFTENYFKAQIESFSVDNQMKIFLIKNKGRVLVAAIIIFYGDRVYYHNSGSNYEGLKINASYRLMWEVIQEAKRRSCKYFDMWGAVPPGKPNHRFAGPSLFKEGFGGERVDWLPAHDLPVNLKYWGTYLFEIVRKRMRGL